MQQQISQEAAEFAASLGERFRQRFGHDAHVFRAPGRVNLIGEHTDYNDGFVMPAAIEFYTWIAAAPREDGQLRIASEQFNDVVEFNIDALTGPPTKHWSDYVRGVAAVMQSSGVALRGADLLVNGQVPLGAGLSSSAAIEVATALALSFVSEQKVALVDLVKMCQRAEHVYVGTRCGIMDQFISAFGQAEHALMLDCRSLQYELLPVQGTARIVICNTNVKHQLSGGEYNERRADCETGVEILRKHLPHVHALRDVTLPDLEAYKSELPERVYRRCRHVVSEIERVPEAARALQSGDLVEFGRLMYDSHRSLRDDYEVSCRELDIMVEAASKCAGVYGARMTGGGFGGCTVNLVKAANTDELIRTVSKSYQEQTNIAPDIYVCTAAQGAGIVL